MRAAAIDETLLAGLAGLIEHERAAFADQDAGGIRCTRERLSFQLLVTRIGELRDGRIAAQLATERAAAVRAATWIERDHRVLFADQHLRAVRGAGLQILFATSVVWLRHRGVARGTPIGVGAASRAAARNDTVQPAVTSEHGILRATRRRTLVLRAAGVARFVATKVAARSLLGGTAAAGPATRRLDKLTRLARELSLGVDTARLTLLARASDARLATGEEQQRPKQKRY
jgi:hypothetical protein